MEKNFTVECIGISGKQIPVVTLISDDDNKKKELNIIFQFIQHPELAAEFQHGAIYKVTIVKMPLKLD